MPTQPDKATQTFITNIETKTGKTIAQWVKLARQGGAKHGAMMKYLKTEHGLSHGYANFIALQALDDAPKAATVDAAVDEQYTGAKAALRPIYDKLMAAVQRFGEDVEVAPKKGYISLRRKKQFACLFPSTATRFDVGLILKNVPPGDRLEASGSFNAMVTHRVRVTDVKEVDKELVAWLRQAYDAA